MAELRTDADNREISIQLALSLAAVNGSIPSTGELVASAKIIHEYVFDTSTNT